MENKEKEFKFTYSAAEQEEIKKIREKYSSDGDKREDKISRLRRLDRSVTQKAEAISLIFGIIGTLIMGFGMSLVMSDLAVKIGIASTTAAVILGIIIGIAGGALLSLAYPMYNLVIKRGRKKIAPEVLMLTDELINK